MIRAKQLFEQYAEGGAPAPAQPKEVFLNDKPAPQQQKAEVFEEPPQTQGIRDPPRRQQKRKNVAVGSLVKISPCQKHNGFFTNYKGKVKVIQCKDQNEEQWEYIVEMIEDENGMPANAMDPNGRVMGLFSIDDIIYDEIANEEAKRRKLKQQRSQ